MKNCHNKTALFPGSFDPFTLGHFSIVERTLCFMDKVVIAIGVNDSKQSCFPLEEREVAIKRLFKGNPGVEVIVYRGLTVDAAADAGADVIVRGVRTVADFEYEKNIADINKRLSGIETVVLFTDPDVSHISSSVVRELVRFGKDISRFVPGQDDAAGNKE